MRSRKKPGTKDTRDAPRRGFMQTSPKRWKSLAGCLLAAVSAAGADSLQQRLEAMAKSHPGKVALYAKHLKTGDVVAIDADTPVKTASVIKLPIMLEAFAQVKAGRRSLKNKIVLDDGNKVPG